MDVRMRLVRTLTPATRCIHFIDWLIRGLYNLLIAFHIFLFDCFDDSTTISIHSLTHRTFSFSPAFFFFFFSFFLFSSHFLTFCYFFLAGPLFLCLHSSIYWLIDWLIFLIFLVFLAVTSSIVFLWFIWLFSKKGKKNKEIIILYLFSGHWLRGSYAVIIAHYSPCPVVVQSLLSPITHTHTPRPSLAISFVLRCPYPVIYDFI